MKHIRFLNQPFFAILIFGAMIVMVEFRLIRSAEPAPVLYSHVTHPEKCYAGQSCRIVYWTHRIKECPSVINSRWYSEDHGGYAPEFAGTSPAALADLTSDFEPFPVAVTIPENMPTGEWVYSGHTIPVEHCVGLPPTPFPPATLQIVGKNNG